MVDHATAKYLNENIGSVLSTALSEMAVQQPNDGVDFLSQWLKTYAEQEEIKAYKEAEEKQLEEDRATTQKKEAKKAKDREDKAAEKQKVVDAYQNMLERLNDPEKRFEESYWSEVVNVSKDYMGAQSVYLGLLDEEGLTGVEPPLIRYTHENIFAGSPSLLDKILPKMNEKTPDVENMTYGALLEGHKDLEEEQKKAKCLWAPPLPPQPPVPEGEEPPPPPEGPKCLSVSVPCVTDCSTMHYFEMPRLGAYLVTPLVYSSYYTQGAFDEAKKFEEEKAADEKARIQKQEEREAAIKEAEEAGTELPPEDEEPVPEKVMTLTPTTVKMVLCMDTLGTNTLFDESKFADMMALCDACAACKARTETLEIDEQALFAIGDERREAAEDPEQGLPNLREDAATARQAELDEELQGIASKVAENPAADKAVLEELCGKKFVYLKAKSLVGYYRSHISTFIKMYYTVAPEVLQIMAALAFFIGYTNEDVFPPRKSALKWWRIKSLLDGDQQADLFFKRIDEVSLEVGTKEQPRKCANNEQKLASIKAMLAAPNVPAEFNEETAKAIDPAFEVLWSFFKSALDYRESVLRQAQAEYDERKKKAEEEDPPAPFEEPELVTLDDDFEGLAPAS